MSFEELKLKSYGALSRAICWLTESFEREETREKHFCNDIPGYSFVLPCLVNVIWNQFDVFSPRLMECRGQDFPSSVNNFLAGVEKIRDLDEYLDIYTELLAEVKEGVSYESWEGTKEKARSSYGRLFRSCLPCTSILECLYMFKEVLSFLDPRFIRDGFMRKLLHRHVHDTTMELEKTLIGNDKEKRFGWAWSHTKKDVDPYVTARILDWIYRWKDHFSELRLREELAVDSSFFKACVTTIEELQMKEEKAPRYMYGDPEDIEGSWREIELGRLSIYRVRAAADIATILHRIGGNPAIIEKAKSFIDRAFGGYQWTLDSTIFMDLYKSTISDITGTAGAVDFYVKTQAPEKACDSFVTTKIQWLLQQQRPEGPWRVLSDQLAAQPETQKWLRDPLRHPMSRYENNTSIPNTTLMIDVLMSFLKALSSS